MDRQKSFFQYTKEVIGDINTPAELVTQWQYFVDECKEGYQWDVSEYFNEISVRSKLEKLLSSPQLQDFDQFQELKAVITEIDDQFKNLLKKGVRLGNKRNWWEGGVLKKAGEPYSQYFKQAYDVDVEIV